MNSFSSINISQLIYHIPNIVIIRLHIKDICKPNDIANLNRVLIRLRKVIFSFYKTYSFRMLAFETLRNFLSRDSLSFCHTNLVPNSYAENTSFFPFCFCYRMCVIFFQPNSLQEISSNSFWYWVFFISVNILLKTTLLFTPSSKYYSQHSSVERLIWYINPFLHHWGKFPPLTVI